MREWKVIFYLAFYCKSPWGINLMRLAKGFICKNLIAIFDICSKESLACEKVFESLIILNKFI